ncbi:large ribosomal subunit protein mL65 [Macrobrachium rosenbergii]|uniref:large ribosomal subunit protein mL65 n=1 Tax=Macrobrachium rosenbergii TaxID=79674 RepID=UPI0034D5D0DA
MHVNRLTNTPLFLRVCCTLKRPQGKNYHGAATASEYSPEPEYPPILDMSRGALRRRKKEAWHEKVKNLPTVEQKLIELNMPKYHGYWACQIKDDWHKVNGGNFLRYATRTHVTKDFPVEYYGGVKGEADELAQRIQGQVEDLILLHYNEKLKRENGNQIAITENFFYGLHKIVNGALAPTVEHIRESTVDVRPRIQAFWFLGGIEPDRILRKTRKNYPRTKDIENEPVDRPMQSTCTPALCVRGNLSLPEVVPLDHSLSTSGHVPVETLDPRAYGYKFKHSHATTLTGFWPGDSKEHAQVWYHTDACLKRSMNLISDKYLEDYLEQKMIVASFSQALAHASYLGFSCVNELTYPIVQQSVVSDGRKWHFSTYQMNTCALHSERAIENPVNNILWLNDEQFLFEAVEDSGVKGFNVDVLANLVAMYLKKGVTRDDATPYLGPYKCLAHHPASEEYRQEFRDFLCNYVLSGRPRQIRKPEIYLWEKIYKIDFKTRPYEPPRRFFEPHYAQKHPGQRRLDDYSAVYIPKALRKDKKVRTKPRINSEELFKYD